MRFWFLVFWSDCRSALTVLCAHRRIIRRVSSLSGSNSSLTEYTRSDTSIGPWIATEGVVRGRAPGPWFTPAPRSRFALTLSPTKGLINPDHGPKQIAPVYACTSRPWQLQYIFHLSLPPYLRRFPTLATKPTPVTEPGLHLHMQGMAAPRVRTCP